METPIEKLISIYKNEILLAKRNQKTLKDVPVALNVSEQKESTYSRVVNDLEQLHNNEKDLMGKFDLEFIEVFKHDEMFATIYEAMKAGLSPYKAIQIVLDSYKKLYDEHVEFVIQSPYNVAVEINKTTGS